MKLSTCICFLALSCCPIAAAFTNPLQVHRISVAVRSQAEEHLEQLSKKWDELHAKEKELERKNDPDAWMDFALETLETAIEHVHTKEEVEEEHVLSLHKTLKKVLETEQILEDVVLGANHAALGVDEIVDKYKSSGFGEDDREKRREFTVAELTMADLAHHVGDYAEERLHQVRDTELHVRKEEEDVSKELTRLKWNEEILNFALEEIMAMKYVTEETSPENT